MVLGVATASAPLVNATNSAGGPAAQAPPPVEMDDDTAFPFTAAAELLQMRQSLLADGSMNAPPLVDERQSACLCGSPRAPRCRSKSAHECRPLDATLWHHRDAHMDARLMTPIPEEQPPALAEHEESHHPRSHSVEYAEAAHKRQRLGKRTEARKWCLI